MEADNLTEIETRHIELLEEIRQKLMGSRALWEKYEGSHISAAETLALLDTELELNAELLDLARQRLERRHSPHTDRETS